MLHWLCCCILSKTSQILLVWLWILTISQLPLLFYSVNDQSELCNLSSQQLIIAAVIYLCPQGISPKRLPFSRMTQSTLRIITAPHPATTPLLFLPFLCLRHPMTLWWQTCWRHALEKGRSSVNMTPWPLGASRPGTPHSGPTKAWWAWRRPCSQVAHDTRWIHTCVYCELTFKGISHVFLSLFFLLLNKQLFACKCILLLLDQ